MPAAPFDPDATLADVGEFAFIAALDDVFTQGEHVLVGPGDDAAVLRVKTGHVVVSTDLMVETTTCPLRTRSTAASSPGPTSTSSPGAVAATMSLIRAIRPNSPTSARVASLAAPEVMAPSHQTGRGDPDRTPAGYRTCGGSR
ncbi:MAG TPA: hypothetical protein VM575_03720 [Nocardioides sp.]|nr:hypothetical protein [Nocardioides sp.]